MKVVTRQEFGAQRTVCACADCTMNCRFIPGYLIPDDLERIAKARGWGESQIEEWAMQELLASPGATVLLHDGTLARIPTLVPARRADNACRYLDADNRCSIHEAAPFGCAFFDAHQSRAASDALSARGLKQIIVAVLQRGLYIRIWEALERAGRRAPGPEVLRKQMRAELKKGARAAEARIP